MKAVGREWEGRAEGQTVPEGGGRGQLSAKAQQDVMVCLPGKETGGLVMEKRGIMGRKHSPQPASPGAASAG